MSRGNGANYADLQFAGVSRGTQLQMVVCAWVRKYNGDGWRARSADADVADSGNCSHAVPKG